MEILHLYSTDGSSNIDTVYKVVFLYEGLAVFHLQLGIFWVAYYLPNSILVQDTWGNVYDLSLVVSTF